MNKNDVSAKYIIDRDDFYEAFNALRRANCSMREIEESLHTDLGMSPVANILDSAYEIFFALTLGEDYWDDSIYDILNTDVYETMIEPEEGYNKDYSNGIKITIPYEKYYEYFILRDLSIFM